MSEWGRGRNQDAGGGGFGSRGPAVEMEVSCRDVPRIIGRGGSKIRQLQDDSGCRINIRKDTDNGVTTVVELQGDPGAQQRAKNLIEDFLSAADYYGGSDRGYSDRGRNGGGGGGGGFYDRRGGGGGGYSDRRGGGGGGFDRRGGGGGGAGYDDRDAIEMEISSRDVGRVIGKGGSKIRELQEESGARIKIRKDKDNGVTTAIELQGSSEAQQRAKELIEDFVSTDGRDNYNNY